MAESSELERGIRFFLEAFNAKRFANRIQEEAITRLVIVHGYDTFKEGVEWAAKIGMSRGQAVVSLEKALPKWGKRNGRAARAADRNQADPQRYVTGEFAEYIVSGEDYEDEPL
jgi:hypothetical protein